LAQPLLRHLHDRPGRARVAAPHRSGDRAVVVRLPAPGIDARLHAQFDPGRVRQCEGYRDRAGHRGQDSAQALQDGIAMTEADWKTIADIPPHFAQSQPDAIAFSFEGRDTTFKAYDAHTNQVANALIASGVKKGERVCYLGKNSDHYF